MALSQKELDALALSILEQINPEKTEVLLSTGEEFEAPALDIARAFVRATGRQKAAFIALAKAFEPERWKEW